MSSFTYQVVCKGRTIAELKESVEDCLAELMDGKIGSGFQKDLDVKSMFHPSLIADDMEEVESPFRPTNAAALAPHVVEELKSFTEGDATLVGLDSEGIPWHESVHSSSKNFNKDGTWRVRKGVEKDVVAKYYSQFTKKAEPALVSVAMTSIPNNTVAQPELPTHGATTPTNVPPTLPSMPTMSHGHTFETFSANFHTVLANLIAEKKISQEYVNDLLKFFQIDQIWKATEDHKLACFNQWADLGFIQKVG